MSQLSVLLQETARRETEVRTILGLLREHIEDYEGSGATTSSTSRAMSLKERLIGFKGGFGCCGAAWGFRSTGDDEQQQQQQIVETTDPNPSPGMNLAAALAAERQFREANASEEARGTPTRVSLMRLLEETEAGGGGGEREREGEGNDSMCCVCMVRKKGAALIPCGHTYCRVCSREVWVNRGSCPLCNRSILQILDIF
ncbi:RING/U-box superfamily protein [Euphorbia peplus]|nr:RING/U-box superfamily protein [Euphorbia peplus]